MQSTANIAELSAKRESVRRLFSVFSVFFLAAQLFVAAHNATYASELEDHSPLDCASCLASFASDDPEDHGVVLAAPVGLPTSKATAIPDALLTETTVRAAAPRAPPLS